MDHKQLHKKLSTALDAVIAGKISNDQANLIFKGAISIIKNSKQELDAIGNGFTVECPLLGITKSNVDKVRKENLNKSGKD